MFFQDRITKITSRGKVLEVGPGGSPYPRSNVLLERRFPSEKEAFAQRGYVNKAKTNQKVVYYDGGKFPFADKEFDYVICSHVLEHIPKEELSQFMAELQRVGRAGFIEYPNVFYEFINYQPVHQWFMNYRDNTILFMHKSLFESNYIHQIYREMFYGSDKYMFACFSRYPELFFSAFEWEGVLEFKIVDRFDDLVVKGDYEMYKLYFSNYKRESFWKVNVWTKLKKLMFRIRLFLPCGWRF